MFGFRMTFLSLELLLNSMDVHRKLSLNCPSQQARSFERHQTLQNNSILVMVGFHPC